MRQKGFAPVIIIFILAAIGMAAIYYLSATKKPESGIVQPTNTTKAAVASPTPSLEDNTEEEKCVNNGGEWKKVGPRPVFECSIKMKDAGKQCRGNNDCEGECLAPEAASLGEQAVGTCSAYNIHLGCFSTVENGKVSPVKCFD